VQWSAFIATDWCDGGMRRSLRSSTIVRFLCEQRLLSCSTWNLFQLSSDQLLSPISLRMHLSTTLANTPTAVLDVRLALATERLIAEFNPTTQLRPYPAVIHNSSTVVAWNDFAKRGCRQSAPAVWIMELTSQYSSRKSLAGSIII